MREARRTRRAIYGLAISPSEKLLLILLTEVSAPQADLAAYLHVTPRRVRQMTASLVGRGMLTVRKSGRRNWYQIDPDGTPKSK
jgi:DNA-binding MarR family transcriptional regulator